MAAALTALSHAIWFAFWAITSGDNRMPLDYFRGPLIAQAVEPAAEGRDCGASRLGSTTVATLNSTPLITVFANDIPLVLVLDTGAQRTVVSPAAAERIGGDAPQVEFQRRLHGIAGALPVREIELRSYRIGGVPIPSHRVTVSPIAMPQILSTALDGVLGTDVLSAFDIDLDLPHYRVTFYERNHCSNPNWSGQYVKVDAGRSLDDHLFFPVFLDNHRITAIIDTGSQKTVLSTTAAARMGATGTILAHDRPIKTKGAAGQELSSHVHKFRHLDISPFVIRNPEIVVTDLRLRDADIILGMDLLATYRVWLSYASFRVFLAKD